MKVTPMAEDIKNIVENILYSYESRLESVETILDTTHQLLKNFQGSFLDMRKEREKINAELRENLAKNESLRKKDFDDMMQGILLTQDEREKEVRNLLNSYINDQKEMAQALRNNLGKFKDSLVKGEAERVEKFKALIKEILAKQEKRKKEVISILKEFHKEQEVLASKFKELLSKGRELRTKDLKSMLKEFKTKHNEKFARQVERKKEVCHLLGDFKKERAEVAKNWRSMQTKLSQRRAISPEEVRINLPKKGVY